VKRITVGGGPVLHFLTECQNLNCSDMRFEIRHFKLSTDVLRNFKFSATILHKQSKFFHEAVKYFVHVSHEHSTDFLQFDMGDFH
jgi:hypothetical protein